MAKEKYSELFSILNQVKDRVMVDDSSKGIQFQAILQKYKSATNNDAFLYKNCLQELDKGVKKFSYEVFVKDFVKHIGYNYIGKALDILPQKVEILAVAYSTGFAIGDAITGISDKSQNYAQMFYIAPIEDAMEQVATQYKSTFLTEYEQYSVAGDIEEISNKLYDDAQNYDCAYRMLQVTNEYLYNCLYKIGAGGKAIDIGDIHIGQVSEIMNFAAGFLHFWKHTPCHGSANIIVGRYKIAGFRCPVDVYVYSSNNELLAAIVDEKVEVSNSNITILLSNEKKTIIYPKDELYKLKIVARESGTMDYQVSEVDDDNVRSIEYYGLPLSIGKIYSGEIVSQFSAPKESYALHTDEVMITPDYDSGEKNTCLDTPTDLAWSGSTAIWKAVAGAIGYRVFIYKDAALFKEVRSANNRLELERYAEEPGQYAFAVIAMSDENASNSQRSGLSKDYCFSKDTTSKSNSGSGGGTVSGKYLISVEDVANGKISVSTSIAKGGDTVTITAESDKGYKLDTLTVTDGSGKTISTTKKSDTVYTFTMPTSDVKVGVTYVKDDSAAVEPTTGFTDVADSAWYANAVKYAVDKDMMNGVGNNKFAPDGVTSRGMIVTVLYRLENEPSAAAASFTDVASGAYYANAVAWASANGIVTGYSNGKFGPNDKITREEFAAILYRYAQYKKYDVSASASLDGYTDAQSISSYAVPAVQWACGAGVMNGSNGRLTPKSGVTRAQVAQLLMNFCEEVVE